MSVEEARRKITQALQPVATEEVGIAKAAGRVLATDAVAAVDLPLFANSSMDGYAIRAEDAFHASQENPIILQVVADIPAGKAPEVVLSAGQTARIMTGGQIPAGANAVVPVENTDQANNYFQIEFKKAVKILSAPQRGDYIRPRGQSVRAGEIILRSGSALAAQDIGALASVGTSRVEVYRLPKIALLTTGDELLSPGQPLESGKIYDSNTYMLTALIEQYGGRIVPLGITPDQPEAIRANLEQARIHQVDLILSSAGVSVGAFDFVKTIMEESGQLDFWKVNMRPGKPLAFGNYQGIPFIGLPGNPVSAFVGFLVFVIPALQRMAGLKETSWPRRTVWTEHPIESDGRETYFRALVRKQNGRLTASLKEHQGSDNLIGLARTNALLIIPSGVKSLPVDSEAKAWLLRPNGLE